MLARSQIGALADEAQAHTIAVQLTDLDLERLDEQRHQAHDLGTGSTPILATENEQRERADIALHALLDHHAHGSDAGSMTLGTSIAARACPAPVAVHDDGDVARQRCRTAYFCDAAQT
jgi:hypothetical protein